MRIAVTLAWLCLSLSLSAQSPGVGWVLMPDGGWLPPGHPATVGRVERPPLVPPVEAPQALADACAYYSPYAERPGCVVGDYRIGQTYAFGVSHGIVIGLSMASSGAEVVTVQYVHEAVPGHMESPPVQVWCFVNDGSQRPWEWRR